MKYVFLDLETTGTDAKKSAIIQLAMLIIAPDGEDSLNVRVKPFEGAVIEEKALDVNGISLVDAQINGLRYAQLYKAVRDLLSTYIDQYKRSDKAFLVGYNIGFDDSFLRNLWDRHGDKYYGSWFFWPPLDVAVLACNKLRHTRHKMSSFKLDDVAIALEVDRVGDAHDAMSDVLLTRDIFFKIIGGST